MIPAGHPRRLFALLVVATLFEGFDTKLASLVLPLLGREFGAGPRELGAMLSFTGVGILAAAALLPLADRFGRRPLFLAAVAGFAGLTLATAAATSLELFGALQFGARLLLVIELALAYVMLGEELPPETRGRANALLGAFASVGASLPAFFLAPLEAWGLGWRGLFALGALPLLLWPVYARVLREPPLARAGLAGERPPWRELWTPALRPRLIGASALWFTLSFWSSTALYFFTYYAFEERGWTAAHLQLLPCGLRGGDGTVLPERGRRLDLRRLLRADRPRRPVDPGRHAHHRALPHRPARPRPWAPRTTWWPRRARARPLGGGGPGRVPRLDRRRSHRAGRAEPALHSARLGAAPRDARHRPRARGPRGRLGD